MALEIREAQKMLYASIREKGFMDGVVPIPEQIALVHSELSEALEAYRNGEPLSWTDDSGKPQGIASEYIDAIIRLFNYCSHLEIDVEQELRRKHEYNQKRPFKHGGKLI